MKKYDDTLCGELTFDCCCDCFFSNKEDGCCDREDDVNENLVFIGNHMHCGLHKNGSLDSKQIGEELRKRKYR